MIDISKLMKMMEIRKKNSSDTQQRQSLSLKRVYGTVLHFREKTNEKNLKQFIDMMYLVHE